MVITYLIDPGKDTVYITAVGVTKDQEWKETSERINQDPKYHDHINVILDMRQHESVVSTDFVWDYCFSIANKSQPVKWAIIISREVSLGMTNMLSELLSRKNFLVKPYTTIQEAEAWISETLKNEV